MHLTNFTKTYIAIFDHESVIFAWIDKKIRKEYAKAIKKQMKADKIPLMQRNAYVIARWNDFADQYLKKSKEEIICEDSHNFDILYRDIDTIKLSPYKTHSNKTHEDGPILGQIWFITGSEKHHFNHKYMVNDDKIALLREQMGDRFILLK